MSNIHYAFIRGGIVEDIYVFETQNQVLADNIANSTGFEKAVLVGTQPPVRYSTFNATSGTFVSPSQEFLVSIGVIGSTPTSTP